jgi:preprotein translocase subunit SecG
MKNLHPANEGRRFTAIAFFLFFAISFVIYYVTSEGGPTPYNNFVRLADAFLHGRLYLLEDITWLELAEYNGKYYIIPPPMPAILILPFVAIFGLSFNQALASIFLGSLNVSIAFLIAKEITINRSVQIWTTVMFGFGTIHWWLAATGWVWFISQVTSATFLLLAIYVTFKGKQAFLSGFFLGASYLSRITTILSLPFFIVMFFNKWFNDSKRSSFISRLNFRPLIYLG